MSEVFICVAMTCLNVLLWIVFFVLYKKKFSAEKILSDIKIEVNKLVTEINKAADQSISLTDARRKGLQKLLDEAKRYTELATSELDKRARSQNLIGALQDTQASPRRTRYNSSGASLVPQSFPSEDNSSFFPSLLDEQTDEVLISEDASVRSHDAEDAFVAPSIPKISKAVNSVKVEKDIRTRVLELSAEGFSSDLIAAKLEVSITEVQLIIDMYGI